AVVAVVQFAVQAVAAAGAREALEVALGDTERGRELGRQARLHAALVGAGVDAEGDGRAGLVLAELGAGDGAAAAADLGHAHAAVRGAVEIVFALAAGEAGADRLFEDAVGAAAIAGAGVAVVAGLAARGLEEAVA